jgi:hypothetical protein
MELVTDKSSFKPGELHEQHVVDSITTRSTFFLNYINVLTDGACKDILVQARKERGKV